VEFNCIMAGRFVSGFLAALVFVQLCTALCLAQGRNSLTGGGHFASGYRGGHHGSSFSAHPRSRYDGSYFFGDLPFLYDDYAPLVPEQGGPSVVVLQPPAAPESVPARKATPLLIELEGDRYVRYGGVVPSPSGDEQAKIREPKTTSNRTAVANNRTTSGRIEPQFGPDPESTESRTSAMATIPLTPTVLVYRDGHREEVPDYAIVGRVLYVHGGETGSYGIKNIEISTLDLAATIETNRQNGVNFVLPTGPNEVVTRP
jgi:hypothetical protein